MHLRRLNSTSRRFRRSWSGYWRPRRARTGKRTLSRSPTWKPPSPNTAEQRCAGRLARTSSAVPELPRIAQFCFVLHFRFLFALAMSSLSAFPPPRCARLARHPLFENAQSSRIDRPNASASAFSANVDGFSRPFVVFRRALHAPIGVVCRFGCLSRLVASLRCGFQSVCFVSDQICSRPASFIVTIARCVAWLRTRIDDSESTLTSYSFSNSRCASALPCRCALLHVPVCTPKCYLFGACTRFDEFHPSFRPRSRCVRAK